MTPPIIELAPAKLNLALHVRARRPDGYHELDTLFAFVTHGDRILVAPGAEDSFMIEGPFASALRATDDNLVLRARDAFREAFGVAQPVAITLVKHLPVASGIGGGSADAAATLRALARLEGVALDEPRLMRCAADLGSDVPACLLGRTARGQGRGEVLEPLDWPAGMPTLLVNPGVAVSTAAVFARWDGIDRGGLPSGDVLAMTRDGRNDLEPPARLLAPMIAHLLATLAEEPGCTLARMSGSGATCFALFETADARSAAAGRIRSAHPGWWCLETALS